MVTCTSGAVIWAVLLTALTLAIQECRYTVPDTFIANAIAHVALQPQRPHGKFIHILVYTPVSARHVWELQGPLPLSVRSAQHYIRNVIKSSCCVPCCQWEEEQQPVQSFWLSTHKEHSRTNAVWAKQPSLNHQGHVDFLIFYYFPLLHSLNCYYASFPYPSEIFSYWRK